jgi:hypothetical protein
MMFSALHPVTGCQTSISSISTNMTSPKQGKHGRSIDLRLIYALPVRLDIKNEARVHLWYEAKFGSAIAPYSSTAHAITTFPTTAIAIGVQPTSSGPLISAPFGLADLFGLIVRPNKAQITRSIYEAKATRWKALWPQLTIIEW